jgi:hypothetical protein
MMRAQQFLANNHDDDLFAAAAVALYSLRSVLKRNHKQEQAVSSTWSTVTTLPIPLYQ